MRVEDALRGVARLFLDSAPVIYFVEEHPRYVATVTAIFDAIDTGAVQAATWPVTLAECLVVPVRLGSSTLGRRYQARIVAGRNTIFLPLAEAAARRASELRAHNNLGLTDAFQAAVAIAAGCDAILTNDAAFRRVSELRVLLVDELDP